jgi:phosphotriesterase-related protein
MHNADSDLFSRRKMMTALGMAAVGASLRAQPQSGTGVIRTVLDDIRPDSLGTKATLFHEHLSFEWAKVRGTSDGPPGPAKDPAPIVEQLTTAAAEGVGCIVDAGTTDVGRDVEFLKRIAAQTSIHIVACGGLYMERNYPASVATQSEDAIADDVAREARTGRYGALGEIGEMPNAPMSALERKVFRSIGRAHEQTNLPIFTHNAYGTGPNVPRDAGLRQLDAFESVGVDPRRIAVGHTCCLDDPKAEVIIEIAKRGAFVGFDRVTGGLVPDDKKVVMVLALLAAGMADRLLLSADYNFTARSAARPGYASALTVFVPQLRQAGVNDAVLRQITIENPRRFLGFVPR